MTVTPPPCMSNLYLDGSGKNYGIYIYIMYTNYNYRQSAWAPDSIHDGGGGVYIVYIRNIAQ